MTKANPWSPPHTHPQEGGLYERRRPDPVDHPGLESRSTLDAWVPTDDPRPGHRGEWCTHPQYTPHEEQNLPWRMPTKKRLRKLLLRGSQERETTMRNALKIIYTWAMTDTLEEAHVLKTAGRALGLKENK